MIVMFEDDSGITMDDADVVCFLFGVLQCHALQRIPRRPQRQIQPRHLDHPP